MKSTWSQSALKDSQMTTHRRSILQEDDFDSDDMAGWQVQDLNHGSCDSTNAGFSEGKLVTLKDDFANIISCKNAGKFLYLINFSIVSKPNKNNKHTQFHIIYTTGQLCQRPFDTFGGYDVDDNEDRWPNWDMQKNSATAAQQFWASRDDYSFTTMFAGQHTMRAVHVNNFFHTPKKTGEIFCFIVYDGMSYIQQHI